MAELDDIMAELEPFAKRLLEEREMEWDKCMKNGEFIRYNPKFYTLDEDTKLLQRQQYHIQYAFCLGLDMRIIKLGLGSYIREVGREG